MNTKTTGMVTTQADLALPLIEEPSLYCLYKRAMAFPDTRGQMFDSMNRSSLSPSVANKSNSSIKPLDQIL